MGGGGTAGDGIRQECEAGMPEQAVNLRWRDGTVYQSFPTDMMGFVPFKDWLQYPVCASLICRGCTHDCVTCGGSAYSFREHFGRDRVAFRDPDLLVRDIKHIQRYINGKYQNRCRPRGHN